MSTSAVGNTSSSSSPTQLQNQSLDLKPTDFINMMITELQNQDPMQPASNEQLLAQMSEIGQLQSSTDLQTAMQSMSLQSNIASASNMIGKQVAGIDSNNTTISGVVNSIQVAGNNVSLQLDSGKTLSLGSVTSVAPGPTGTTAGSTPVTN